MKYFGMVGLLALFFVVLTYLPQHVEKVPPEEQTLFPIVAESSDKNKISWKDVLKLNCECHQLIKRAEDGAAVNDDN